MPLITYEEPRWLRAIKESDDPDFSDVPARSAGKMELIVHAVSILNEYEKQGYQLTLRQLYYQFVARDLIPNRQREYKRLGDAVNDGRMWGLIDWDHIVDRGRNLITQPHWSGAPGIIRSAAASFNLDCWTGTDHRLEVWVEKQALEEVVSKAADPWDVPYLACKGYMSQSEMWAAAQRIEKYHQAGQETVIIHLGDHDPSGIDMSRDIQDRLGVFGIPESIVKVERIALNFDQVQEHNPPPNPAKETDARFRGYRERFGDESWELDALEPRLLDDLIQETIAEYATEEYHQRREEEEEIRSRLDVLVEHWDDVDQFLTDNF